LLATAYSVTDVWLTAALRIMAAPLPVPLPMVHWPLVTLAILRTGSSLKLQLLKQKSGRTQARAWNS